MKNCPVKAAARADVLRLHKSVLATDLSNIGHATGFAVLPCAACRIQTFYPVSKRLLIADDYLEQDNAISAHLGGFFMAFVAITTTSATG